MDNNIQNGMMLVVFGKDEGEWEGDVDQNVL